MAAGMQLSGGPDGGLSGGIDGFRFGCSLREDPSGVDPAGFEQFVSLLQQGSAGQLRAAASARILQREADKMNLLAKAALGAAYSISDDPERLYTSPPWAASPAKELHRNRAAWDERYAEMVKKQFKYAESKQKIVDAAAKTGGGGPDMGTPEPCTGDCEKVWKLFEALKFDDQCADFSKGNTALKGVEMPEACKDDPSNAAAGGAGALGGGAAAAASLLSLKWGPELFLIPAQPFEDELMRRQAGREVLRRRHVKCWSRGCQASFTSSMERNLVAAYFL